MAAAVAAWIAGAVGATFVTGVGAVAVASVLAVNVISALVYIAFAVGMAAISKAMVGQPSLADKMAGLQQTIRAPAAPRRLIYGRAKVGGTLAYIGSTGHDNAMLHMAVTLAGHEVDAIESVYANDTLSDDSRYSKAPRIVGAIDITFTNEGDGPGRIRSTGETPTLMNGGSFDSSYTALEVTGSLYNDGIYRIRGTARNDTTSNMLNVLRTDGQQIVTEPAGAAVTIAERYLWTTAHLGAADQAADADMVARLSDWTTDHRLRGVAYLYAGLVQHADVWTSGLPNFTAVVRGKNCYDPRDGITRWTQNPALILADYLCDSMYGFGADYATEIDEPALIAAAGVCDELVAGEPRYTCDAVIESSESPESVLPKLAGAMAGSYVYSGGVWTIRAGAYYPHLVTLTEQHLRGSIKVQPRLSRQDLFNSVRGTFVSHDHNYQTVDIPPLTDTTAVAQDNGETIWVDLELPYTSSNAVAQRLAWIALARARQQITVEVQTTLAGLQVRAGDTVALSNTRFGWIEKPFEVVGWRFAVYDDAAGAPALGVDLTLRETASTVFSGVATLPIDASPDTTLPSPWEIDPVTGLLLESGTEHLLIQADGTITNRVLVTWTAPEGATHYQIEYATGDIRTSINSTVPSAYVDPAVEGALYAIRVRALNHIGTQSDWVSGTHTALGKSVPPADVTGFVGSQNGANAVFRWDQVTDRDLAGYKLRYMSQNAPFDWALATELTSVTRGTQVTSAMLAPGAWFVGIKAVDTSGNESLQPAVITVTVVNRNDAVYGEPQGPTWAGELDGFAIVGDSLQLGGNRTTGRTWAYYSGQTWGSL